MFGWVSWLACQLLELANHRAGPVSVLKMAWEKGQWDQPLGGKLACGPFRSHAYNRGRKEMTERSVFKEVHKLNLSPCLL